MALEYIGKYRVLKRLGAGGFGAVYLCHDSHMARDVAIKVFQPKDDNLLAFATSSDEEALQVLRQRFLREARILARLDDCPYIVSALEFGELDDGSPWYAMPYVPDSLARELGKDVFDENALRDLPQNERPRAIGTERALRLLAQLLEGLAEAHALGLVHRDIKPSNILLSEKGDVRLADFGIAKAPDGQQSTVSHLGIGSRNYMAPEQRESAKHVDARADIYSVGILAYRMLSGRLPTGRYADPEVHNPAIGSGLNACILRALSERAADRFADASEMLAAWRAGMANRQQSTDSATRTFTATDVGSESGPVRIPDRLRPIYQLIEESLLEHGSIAPHQAEIKAMAHVLELDHERVQALVAQVGESSPQLAALERVAELIGQTRSSGVVTETNVDALLPAARLAGKDGDWLRGQLGLPSKPPVPPSGSSHMGSAFDTVGTLPGTATTPELVRRVQHQLRQLGYQVAESGQLDSRTRKEIERFEESQNLRPTGDVDPLLLDALGKAVIQADDDAWRQAIAKATSDSCDAYVETWPEGRHAAEVDTHKDDLAWEEAKQQPPACTSVARS